MKLRNVVFPQDEPGDAPQKWDLELVDGVVTAISPAQSDAAPAGPDDDDGNVASRLALPPLCHPHIHLDKAYLLTGACDACHAGSSSTPAAPGPSYLDLLPQTGDFAEALRTTAVAKSRFTAADLYRRGAQLLATSARQGVTAARVFVEVDAGAAGQGAVPVHVAGRLRDAFRGLLAVQVCAFAQEPVFAEGAAVDGPANRAAMECVLEADGRRRVVSVLGTTPYVEATRAQALQNIDWAVATALRHGLHLDVHLDYNLDDPAAAGRAPLLYALLDSLEAHGWRTHARDGHGRCRTVVVGHATQLTRLADGELAALADRIRGRGLPVHLVGLANSDVYMMGRQDPSGALGVPAASPRRGTLSIPRLLDCGLAACLGVNNVGNAFTPHGSGDPLQLACAGVGLYHAGTGAAAQQLYGSVSWLARQAIGMEEEGGSTNTAADDAHPEHASTTAGWPGSTADPSALLGRRLGRVLLVDNERFIRVPGWTDDAARDQLGAIPARVRLGYREVVWDPPDVSLRRVV